MGETKYQIENHIENTRADLGANLQELEYKVKSVTDWRQQVSNHPMTMLGIAFGGGVLLATLAGGRTYRRAGFVSSVHDTQNGAEKPSKVLEAWDNIKGALIGVAATRFKEFVDEVVPGFHEHYERTQDRAKALPPYSL